MNTAKQKKPSQDGFTLTNRQAAKVAVEFGIEPDYLLPASGIAWAAEVGDSFNCPDHPEHTTHIGDIAEMGEYLYIEDASDGWVYLFDPEELTEKCEFVPSR